MGSEGAGAPPAPLRPEECLDLDLWDHIFDDAAVLRAVADFAKRRTL